MKKLTAGIFATLLTVVTVGVANADIASTAWVNTKISESEEEIQVGVDSKIEQVENNVEAQFTSYNQQFTAELADKLDTATASQTYATKSALDSKLNKNLGAGSSGNILTVGSDGAITSSATIAQGKVNGLTTALDGKADASALTTLETEVGNKLDKNLGTGKSGYILTVGSDGAITSSATIAQGKVSGLATTLAGKANASELDNKLDKNLGTGKSGYILTVDSNGAITSSATIAQGKVDGLDTALEGKADKATTLAGYGITDGATKTELNAKADESALTTLETEVAGKQDKLNTNQLSAVNSGITSSKVSTYDGYNTKITTATETATEAKTAADAATEAASTATSTASAAKSAADAATKAAETATSTANAAKSAADAATEAAESAASSASSAVTSASKAIPKPADTEINSDGVFVLTYNATNKEYAWERITR